MRERARDKGRLEDIIEYSNNVTELIDGHTLATFVANKGTYYSAEEWITDDNAVNKKNTRLYPGTAKFRRKTIDRKDMLFETIKNMLNSK